MLHGALSALIGGFARASLCLWRSIKDLWPRPLCARQDAEGGEKEDSEQGEEGRMLNGPAKKRSESSGGKRERCCEQVDTPIATTGD